MCKLPAVKTEGGEEEMKPYGRRVLIQASVRRTTAIVQQHAAQLYGCGTAAWAGYALMHQVGAQLYCPLKQAVSANVAEILEA
jgi:hypothetical protein